MKTIDKTNDLPKTKKILKNYATKLVEVLESKGVNMIKKSDDTLHWQSFREEEDCAEVGIDIYDNIEFGSLSFLSLWSIQVQTISQSQ